jgi:capsular polysaccharide transport system permease protein
MTTIPKARKFRVKRSDPAAPQGQDERPEAMFEDHDDGFGDADFRRPDPARPASRADTEQQGKGSGNATPRGTPAATSEAELAAIRDEGLTGRQLRMARRVAQKHGLTVVSDFDAVRQLRARGVDPFAKSNMLELVGGASAGLPAKLPEPQLPATRKEAPPPAQASTGHIDEGTRAREIMKIQRDIARRRRRKVALLSVRLFFFVLIPTLIAGFYFYVLATPMFATKSEFVIQQADSGAAAGGGLGGLFSGTSMATQQDSISVQSYLLSRDALSRLDRDLGFKAHFMAPQIDALQRLDADGSNEAAYKLYKRMIQIGYDPTEGLIKMEVIAADPTVSEAFSRALIRYAEEQVDQLTARLRADQMQGAMESNADAERRMLEAQQRVVSLQEQLGVVSADVELGSRMSQIGAIETELRERRLRLESLLSNSRPNQAQVNNAQRLIENLEAELTSMRSGMTDGVQGGASLARISAELGVAQMDLTTRQALLQQAAQQLEASRIEANRQVRYLSTSVPPTAPDEATYPRAFENTLLAFLIFCGIYLMISLTASILREQVSA